MDHRHRERQLAAESAAEWMVRLQDPKLSRSERIEYVRWLRRSPLHVAQMLRVSHLQHELTDFPYWNEIAPLASATDPSVVELSSARDPPDRKSLSGRSAWSGRWISVLAASIAFLGIALAYFGDFVHRSIDTGVGERRSVVLADGTVVRLSPETTLRVHFSRSERRIDLTRGNALFRVAKNPAKPFLVETGRARVRVIGTAFGVDRRSDSVVVTVEEGRVAVAERLTEPSSPVARTPSPVAEISLGPDQQVIVPQVGSMGQVRKVDSHRELSWAEGRLVFDHDSVAEVVQQFNRFNRTQIKILDPQLATRPVSAVFNVSDPEAFVNFLESVTNIRVTRASHDTIVIASGGP